MQSGYIELDITPEAIIEGASGGYHVIVFEPFGYHAVSEAGEQALVIFRSAPDAEEYIAGVWDRVINPGPNEPVVQRLSVKDLLRAVRIAESEGARWYLMNPPPRGDATGYPLSELRKALNSEALGA